MLVLATLAVYAQVRHHAFVNFDDHIWVAAIESGFGLDGLKRAFTRHIVSNWIPLTWSMLLVEFDLFGREPANYLLMNVALHCANAVLLFGLLCRWTGALGRSAFVAAVFALHPLHVESVAWFSERKDVLSGLFFMLTLLAYGRWADGPTARRYLAMLCLFALGLMAKPMLVTLPFVLLLLDEWPLKRLGTGSGWMPLPASSLTRAFREKWPLFVLATVASIVAIATQNVAGSLPDTEVLTLSRRMSNAVASYWVYVAQSLWPTGLAVFYPHPVESGSLLRTSLQALALLAVSLAVLRAREPALRVGWFWYLGMLVPVIGLVQVGSQAHADRYVYLPQIGLSIAFAWGMHGILNGWQVAGRPLGRHLLSVSGVAAVAAMAVVSWHQVGHWKDTLALNRRAVEVTRDDYRAHDGLAGALRRNGQLDEAAVHYGHAARLAPGIARTQIGYAEVLAELNRLDEAIAAYQAGLRVAPNHVRARINLGHVLLRAERSTEARKAFERALEVTGGDGEAMAATGNLPFLISLRRGLARALDAEGEAEAAVGQWQKLLERRPNDAAAHIALGELLARLGRIEQAKFHFARGREIGQQPGRKRNR